MVLMRLLLCGISVAIGAGFLLQIVKYVDAEHGLPSKISKKAWLLFAAAGFTVATQKTV